MNFVKINKILESDLIAFDTETTSKSAKESDLVGFSISNGELSAYIPIGHRKDTGVINASESEWRGIVDRLAKKQLIAHNAAFDFHVMRKAGYDLHFTHDTMIQAHCTGDFDRVGLKGLVKTLFNYDQKEFKEVVGKKKIKKTSKSGKTRIVEVDEDFADLPYESAAFYAEDDALYTYKLYFALNDLLTDASAKIYRTEMNLFPVLREMEINGIYMDRDGLNRNYELLLEERENLIALMHRQISRLFDMDYDAAVNMFPLFGANSESAKQKLFFDSEFLGLGVKFRTQKGAPSLAKIPLKTYSAFCPLAANLRILQEMNTAIARVKSDLKLLANNRIHTTFKQSGTETGRIASEKPNVQNWSRGNYWRAVLYDVDREQGEEGWELDYFARANVVAPPGYKFINVDYSQIELRLIAGYIQSDKWLDVYAENGDLHTATAAYVYDIPFSEVTKKQRYVGKTINFSLMYGTGQESFLKRMQSDVSPDYTKAETDALYNQFFTVIPELAQKHKEAKQQAHRTQQVQTLFGRIRTLWGLNSSNAYIRGKVGRQAFNTIIQGSAADMMKFAMIKAHKLIKEKYPEVEIILTVHDSLCFLFPDKYDLKQFVLDVTEKITFEFEGYPKFLVDWDVGPNWHEAKSIDFDIYPDDKNDDNEPVTINLPEQTSSNLLDLKERLRLTSEKAKTAINLMLPGGNSANLFSPLSHRDVIRRAKSLGLVLGD